MSYLETTKNVYRDAALTPDVGLCCTTNPIWELPGLKIPKIMQEMNYGCGSTVNARDLTNDPRVLYVGVGGGMELLQFAYFSRQKSGVVGVDVVDEMLEASRKNFEEAEELNPWFKSEFVDLKKGDLWYCDYGLSRHLHDDTEYGTGYIVTRWYRAPELLNHQKKH